MFFCPLNGSQNSVSSFLGCDAQSLFEVSCREWVESHSLEQEYFIGYTTDDKDASCPNMHSLAVVPQGVDPQGSLSAILFRELQLQAYLHVKGDNMIGWVQNEDHSRLFSLEQIEEYFLSSGVSIWNPVAVTCHHHCQILSTNLSGLILGYVKWGPWNFLL